MRTASVWAAVLVTACAIPVPIQNVDNAAVVSTAGGPLSANQVKEAITRAGIGLGWILNLNRAIQAQLAAA